MSGFKTYIFAALIGIVAFCKAMGYIDDKTVEVLYGLLGAGGLAALRAGVTKNGPVD